MPETFRVFLLVLSLTAPKLATLPLLAQQSAGATRKTQQKKDRVFYYPNPPSEPRTNHR